jgi:hypothetical protein
MGVLNQIACMQKRNDEVPNQELARSLVERGDAEGVAEIALNLWNRDSAIQNDCIKVLYEVGYLRPELIAAYALDFVKLLSSKNNRLVWGGMIALSTVAHLEAEALYPQLRKILIAFEDGSVITQDAGTRVLAAMAAYNAEYSQRIFPYLLNHLETCRTKDVPQHAESALKAVNAANRGAFIAVVEKRLPGMTGPQAKRVMKVLKTAAELA